MEKTYTIVLTGDAAKYLDKQNIIDILTTEAHINEEQFYSGDYIII